MLTCSDALGTGLQQIFDGSYALLAVIVPHHDAVAMTRVC